MDAHLWKNYKENSLNLTYILRENMPSRRAVFNVWLNAWLLADKKKIVRTMYNHNNRYKGIHNGIIPYLLSVVSG